jgi:predicted amidohydrolase
MRAAVVQLNSQADVDANLARVEPLVARAAEGGAELVALPENFPFMRDEATGPHPAAQPLDGPIVGFLRAQARRHGIVLAGGTFPEAIPGDTRVYNTSVVVERDGAVAAVYRKIHLFDVELPGVSLTESRGVAPGKEVVVADTSLGKLGLSVCYDVRFPELYRALGELGAQLLLVPSAFTVPTGRDHWEVLLRARAIENQCFVVAAAQVGRHGRTRETWGHSLVVDPWGRVLVEASDGEGVAFADLDAAELERVRERLPALRHRRLSS